MLRFILLMSILILPCFSQSNKELLVCGWDEVYILDISDVNSPRKIFSWKAQDRSEIPASLKSKFGTTDECKAVSGNRILITSSGDGVALVDRKTGITKFWGECGNAHSAELLPGERIAVACSVRKDNTGNRLVLFDVKTPEKEIYSTELYSGHGVVWDPQRTILWALGGKELRAYHLEKWESSTPSLKLEASYTLPGHGGHELMPISKSPQMIVSVEPGVWIFDRDRKVFSPHPQIHELEHVKSAMVHPESGQLVYTQADSPNWWTSRIRFRNPDHTIIREGERLYKVRWIR